MNVYASVNWDYEVLVTSASLSIMRGKCFGSDIIGASASMQENTTPGLKKRVCQP